MKPAILLAISLGAAAPALAVTPVAGHIGVQARLLAPPTAPLVEKLTQTEEGLPTLLSATMDRESGAAGYTIRAYSYVRATWDSADRGEVTIGWALSAGPGPTGAIGLDTGAPFDDAFGAANFVYAFTTGNSPNELRLVWEMGLSGDAAMAGGLAGAVFTPFGPYFTPLAFAPADANGESSIWLAPNATYHFALWNLGSLYADAGIADARLSVVDSRIRWSIAGVPEPATWAMMIAGFGMAGLAARRRRTHAAAATS